MQPNIRFRSSSDPWVNRKHFDSNIFVNNTSSSSTPGSTISLPTVATSASPEVGNSFKTLKASPSSNISSLVARNTSLTQASSSYQSQPHPRSWALINNHCHSDI